MNVLPRLIEVRAVPERLGPGHPHRFDRGCRLDDGAGELPGHEGALIGLTRAGAIGFGGDGVTVNRPAPGPAQTDPPAAVFTGVPKAANAERTVPDRRADPEERVGLDLLVVSDASRYVTGTALVVDGEFLAGAS